MLKEYEGALAGDAVEDEDVAGRVREESVMRSVTIRLENVLRLPTKMISPSTK